MASLSLPRVLQLKKNSLDAEREQFEKFQKIFEYFGHIARRDGDNLEKIVVTGKVEGKRSRGRSLIRWLDQIHTALDTKVHIALHVAKSRVKWHKIVRKVKVEGVTTLSDEEHDVERYASRDGRSEYSCHHPLPPRWCQRRRFREYSSVDCAITAIYCDGDRSSPVNLSANRGDYGPTLLKALQSSSGLL
ncbi:jg6913 [Pararge aegeria aegeria]|uniref:Jg6913 protein n=1 Tax=Pararge aegeria aegeria TaxID=348720 RepID=A0A8S4S9Q0_9NEOP|nr:jg6913 [Pararge aegeria aegeria]